MVANRIIRFRVEESQFQALKEVSRKKGFSSISFYIRFNIFNKDPLIDQLAAEIQSRIKQEKMREEWVRSDSPAWVDMIERIILNNKF